jgi:TonB family protein
MERPIASLVTSFALHGVGLVLGAWLVSRSLLTEAAAPGKQTGVEVDVATTDGVELPVMSQRGIVGSPNPTAVPDPKPVVPGGGEHVARPELHRAGRGGSAESAQAALNLADSNDGLTLDRDPLNRFDRSQIQRIDTNDERRSLDDRRATPNPTELSFLATGPGRVLERRPVSRVNPSNGSLNGTEPSEVGTELGGPVVERAPGPEARPGGSSPGTDRERVPAGIASGARSRDYRFSAAVTVARPQVSKARAAVPAPELGRPNDTLDSSQDVASAVASLVHASNAGARQRGNGPGGESGGGNPAAGGVQGSGSRASPTGTGLGPARDSGSDARLGAYTAGLRNRLAGWEQAFPTWAIAEGRGGVATLGFTILPDGRITDLRVARSSGIEEFDRKLIEHVRRSAPFSPPPAMSGQRSLPLLFTFDALNPAVGRDGPGRGRVQR